MKIQMRCSQSLPRLPLSSYSLILSLMTFPSHAMEKDDPFLTKIIIDQLEWREAEGDNLLVTEAQAWLGYDLNKVWLKTEIEHVDGHTEEAELRLLYNRGITPFWDAQVGIRHDFQPNSRNWLTVGLQGLAPYLLETDAAFFIGESGDTALRLELGYEILFTQQLILPPEFEINIYGQNDRETGMGSGLSDSQLGLRLRYEIRREFAPYLGVIWIRNYGNSKDYADVESGKKYDTKFAVGLRILL